MGLETTPSISLQNLLDRELQMAAAGTSVAAGQAVPAMAPQDAQIVITGSVTRDGGGLRIRLRALDQASDEIIFEDDAGAANETELLPALDELLAELRDSIGGTPDAAAPTFSGERAITQSLAALQSFSAAEALMRDHDYPAALQQYQRATELDSQFARAWYGAAFAAFAAGQGDVAREFWQQAGTLQARLDPAVLARLRARYFTTLQPDYAKAIAQFEQLVTLLPADGAALQSLARLYRATGQQDKAFAQHRALLALNPQSLSLRTSNAEYALYANEFELAAAAATELRRQAPKLVLPQLILAIAALHTGDVAAAAGHYRQMAGVDVQGASVASSGLADIALFERHYDDALTLLTDGRAADQAATSEYGVASKTAMLAEVYIGQQANGAALVELQALPPSAAVAQLVQAATLYVAAGRTSEAAAIAAQLRERAAPSALAYADMIVGLLAHHAGDYNAAIDAYRRALRKADLWLVRFHIAEAYLQAGYPAEASDEFSKCLARRGEAALLFFDRLPTWRYTAGLAERKALADREFLRQSSAP
jgi:tetratricopeptide (TPR) repeat protein